jgi:hypothetical protein
MAELKVDSFRALMNGQPKATISCMYQGIVVRTLTVDGERVVIDPNTETEPGVHPVISTPLDTPITYRPWTMDRGNMNFEHEEFPDGAKICGEADVIEFPNGDKFSIMPADEQRQMGEAAAGVASLF